MVEFNFDILKKSLENYFKYFLTEMEFHEFGNCLIMKAETNECIVDQVFEFGEWEYNFKYGFDHFKIGQHKK